MKKEKSTDKNISIETEDSDRQEPSFRQEQALPDTNGPSPLIKPVRKKIGEGRDDLRMRSAWFRKRSGTKG